MKSNFLIITLALISLNANAGLNKWVDAEGKVHYSDTPPPEVKTESVRNIASKNPTDAAAPAPQKSLAEREAEMKKAKQTKEEAAQKKAQEDANAEAKKSNCAAARDNIRTLEQSPSITTYNEKGERTLMDDSARAQHLEEARKLVGTSCN